MRVIQTTVYFDAADVQAKAPGSAARRNPGISFACFPYHDPDEAKGEFGINLQDAPAEYEFVSNEPESLEILEARLRHVTERQVEGFIDAALRGKDRFKFRAFYPQTADPLQLDRWIVFNRHLVDRVLSTSIVIEESPVQWGKLAGLLKRNPEAVIGTMVGMGALADHGLLLMVTVPTAIIMVGSAMGISRGLQRGLNKKVERLFDAQKRQAKIADKVEGRVKTRE